jgi:hypothetical protein
MAPAEQNLRRDLANGASDRCDDDPRKHRNRFGPRHDQHRSPFVLSFGPPDFERDIPRRSAIRSHHADSGQQAARDQAAPPRIDSQQPQPPQADRPPPQGRPLPESPVEPYMQDKQVHCISQCTCWPAVYTASPTCERRWWTYPCKVFFAVAGSSSPQTPSMRFDVDPQRSRQEVNNLAERASGALSTDGLRDHLTPSSLQWDNSLCTYRDPRQHDWTPFRRCWREPARQWPTNRSRPPTS